MRDLFDGPSGAELKEQAMRQMEGGKGADWLETARDRLAAFCRERPGIEVTSDDVHRLTPKPEYLHDNILGAVFRDRRFEPTGQWKQTSRPSGRARAVRLYRLAAETHR